MSLTNSWNDYWDATGGYTAGWENMTEAQRIAHSLHFGTDFAKQFDPNQQLTFGGTTQTPDFWYEGQSLFNDIQNYQPAQQPAQETQQPASTPVWQDYGFGNEGGYNQFMNNWNGKFDINTGTINQDWWDSLSDAEKKSTWYDITSGGVGISNGDLSANIRDSIHSAYTAGLEPSSGGDFTFGHGSPVTSPSTPTPAPSTPTPDAGGSDNSAAIREALNSDMWTTNDYDMTMRGQNTPFMDAYLRTRAAAKAKGPVSSLFANELGE